MDNTSYLRCLNDLASLKLPLVDTVDGPAMRGSLTSLMPHLFKSARSLAPQRYGVFLGWELGMIAQNGLIDAVLGLSSAQRSSAGLREINHQGGGLSCHPIVCVGRPVEITSEFEQFAAELCADLNMSGDWLIPDEHPEKWPRYQVEVQAYRSRLANAGYATDFAFADGQFGLIEAMYPFDATPSNLQIIANNPEAELEALEPLLARQKLSSSMLVLVIADSLD